MDNREELNYNEHVKVHQTQKLIEWLESAKTERIQQLHEKAINMPKAKIKIPSPKIEEETIEVLPTIYASTESVDISAVNMLPESNTDYRFTMPKKLFESIDIDKRKIPEPMDEVSVDINLNNFSDIVASIAAPQEVAIQKPMINPFSVYMENISQDISLPEISFQLNDFDMPEDDSITTPESIKCPKRLESFVNDISIIHTFNPECVNFNIEKVPSLNTQQSILPMEEIIPKISPIAKIKITNESIISDNPLPIDLKNISVPPKTKGKGIEFAIDIKKEEYPDISNINAPKPAEKLNIEIKPINNIDVPTITVNNFLNVAADISPVDSISVPQVVVNESPNLKDKVNIPKTEIPMVRENILVPHISSDVSIQQVEIPLEFSNFPLSDTIHFSKVPHSLPSIDDFPNISIPNQENMILIEDIVLDMEMLKIPSISMVHSQISIPQAQNIIDKEISVSVVDIKVPENVLINSDLVYAEPTLLSIVPISKPSEISIPDKMLFDSLPRITLPTVSIPDNTSFLENLKGTQKYS